jgi:hypothetical protein
VEDCALAQAACEYFGLDQLRGLIEAIVRTPIDEVEGLYQRDWDA